jgi:hypothetical protein
LPDTVLVRFPHKGLKRIYERDDASGVSSEMADRQRKMMVALETADNLNQGRYFPVGSFILSRANLKDTGV